MAASARIASLSTPSGDDDPMRGAGKEVGGEGATAQGHEQGLATPVVASKKLKKKTSKSASDPRAVLVSKSSGSIPDAEKMRSDFVLRLASADTYRTNLTTQR